MAPLFAFLIVVSLVIAPTARAQEATEQQPPSITKITRERKIDAPGVFSYMAPEGWVTAEMAGLKYRVALGSPVNGIAPNINIVDEEHKGTIDEYLKINLSVLEKSFEEFKNLGQSAFTTTSSVKGVKVITQAKQQGRLLRQVFFLLRGKGDRKFVVTFTASAEEGNKYDAIVEKAIKTFVLK
jgi:hypothetical protein